ncbi:MAG: 3-oxoacyl-ACP reductase FabG [Cyanobacteriota bacterium]|nr:3-oxoacyl-ACP reductase FabG [Cyanobacteriota bacterium]
MEGQQILLAGGTGGLGVGVVKVFLAQKAELTITYITESEVERLGEQISASDRDRIRFVQANLLEEKVVAQLVDDMPRIDALVHLVGGFSMGKAHEYSYEDWKKDFDLNLNTTFLTCKFCLTKMLDRGYGRIVTVGSRGAVQPSGQLAAYCASKAGVVALTKAIADETKGTNITANSVLPSVIDTPANREAMGDEDAESWVKPESLGKVIAFLASEAAGDVRGAAVPVYGSA